MKKIETATDVRWDYSESERDSLIRRYGVDPQRSMVERSSIDMEASIALQNRGSGVGVDEDYALELAASMVAGDMIAAITAMRYEDGRIVVVDGIHRTHAAEAVGVEFMGAWVIEGTEEQADLMARHANFRHGRATSREHRFAVAMRDLAEGYSIERVADMTGLSADTIRKYKRNRDEEMRAVRIFGIRPKGGSDRFSAIAKFEDEQLEVIGPAIYEQPIKQVVEWAREMGETPASERIGKAHEIKGQVQVAAAPRGPGVRRTPQLSECRRGITTAKKSLPKAWAQATRKERQTMVDEIHTLWTKAQELRDSDGEG